MKKYRLRIDFWIDAIQFTKGDTVDETSTGYQYAKSGYVELLKKIVENNPDIFEEVKPVEVEGVITYHGISNDGYKEEITVTFPDKSLKSLINKKAKLIIYD